MSDYAAPPMGDGCDCVLGQLYGEYGEGLVELALDYRTARATRATCGFTVFETESHMPWDELTCAWRDAILARRAELERS